MESEGEWDKEIYYFFYSSSDGVKRTKNSAGRLNPLGVELKLSF
jgi:hypothetical protein